MNSSNASCLESHFPPGILGRVTWWVLVEKQGLQPNTHSTKRKKKVTKFVMEQKNVLLLFYYRFNYIYFFTEQ